MWEEEKSSGAEKGSCSASMRVRGRECLLLVESWKAA